jgi:hypothetical protein
VILFEIDAEGVSILKFKRYAPRSVHVDRVPDWLPVQAMEVEAQDIHVLRLRSAIELIQPA